MDEGEMIEFKREYTDDTILRMTNKNRTKSYLKLAFSEFVKRVESEQIQTFREYDEKYSIHYLCEEWMGTLLNLLDDSGDKTDYAEVIKCYRKMGM